MIKQIIAAPLMLVLTCNVAHAVAMCAQPDIVTLVVKKDVLPISVSVNDADMTFELEFDYDLMPTNLPSHTVMGMASCNGIATNTAGKAVSRGDANTHLRASNTNIGSNCWCELTEPVTSWWVYYGAYSDDATCASSCVTDCANAIKNNTDGFLTSGIYGAIW